MFPKTGIQKIPGTLDAGPRSDRRNAWKRTYVATPCILPLTRRKCQRRDEGGLSLTTPELYKLQGLEAPKIGQIYPTSSITILTIITMMAMPIDTINMSSILIIIRHQPSCLWSGGGSSRHCMSILQGTGLTA